MKRKKKSLLEQKEEELFALNERSESAVRLVRATVDGLDKTNIQIREKIDEIDEVQKRLSDTRNGFEATFTRNQKVAQNFKALLCVD